jgi:hypothetical protein
MVLSACSQYFKELFKVCKVLHFLSEFIFLWFCPLLSFNEIYFTWIQVLQPLQHPVIVLPGANFTDLCALVTFMYSGEVNIYQEQLPGLLNMADAMQIRGLAEVNGVRAYVSVP